MDIKRNGKRKNGSITEGRIEMQISKIFECYKEASQYCKS